VVELPELVVCLSLNPLMCCTTEYNTTWIRLSACRCDRADSVFGELCFFAGISVTVKGALLTDTEIKSFQLAAK